MGDEPKGRELWLLAGQAQLRRGGVAAVKVSGREGELRVLMTPRELTRAAGQSEDPG